MQKLILVAAFAVGLLTGEAWAGKVVSFPTTKSAVKSQCGGKLSCTADCGSTFCYYSCTKKGCEVTIYRKAPGRPGRPGSAGQ
jgi:hypothetical protein